jgi:bacterial/archaeal transporter family-2 protein
MEALAIPFLLLVGSLLALQAAANVQLSTAMGSPVGASTLQLGVAAALLLTATAAAGTLGAFGLLDDADGWHLVGGLGSALYITAGILLFPRLGAVTSVGLFIAGQMLASLLLDGTGWLGVPEQALGWAAIAGAVAVVVGAATIVRAQAGTLDARPAWIALGLAGGAVLPVQGAVNAQLRSDLDAPIAAGAWSFVVAAAAMAAVLAAVPRAQRASVAGLTRVPWWGWLGGLCGATYVTSVFLLIPEIGVAPTIALTVGGQQIASVFVDRHGLLRLPRRPVTPTRLLGVTGVLAGVALVQTA